MVWFGFAVLLKLFLFLQVFLLVGFSVVLLILVALFLAERVAGCASSRDTFPRVHVPNL